jgi:NAD(P)-dependent dehydrogenase (short-subunit alcohol dehydrogenase family)
MSKSQQLTILITGATAGIGRHAAIHLSARGHRVIATGRNEQILAQLKAAHPAIETLRLDVTSADSIAAAREAVDALTGGRGVDVLVNNAGYGLVGPMEEISDADLRAQFETNVFGLVAVTRAFVPGMRARGFGRVINISSVGGRMVFPFFGAYNATKFAVEAMSDAMRMELRAFGIHVVLVEPGVIKTEFADRSMSFVDRYRRPDSPYAAVLARADKIKETSDRQAVGPEVISRAIERAATARSPRARYVAPFRARLMLRAVHMMPTRMLDWVFRTAIGLTRRRLAASN